jgi:predicted nucleic acid-binding protein
LYLDANVFIYMMEGVEPWARPVTRLFRALDLGECSAATSELTLSECLVRPMRMGDEEIVRSYLKLLHSRPSLSLLPVQRDLLIDAARLRASSSLTLPDAIHLATARRAGCNSFVTNDKRLGSMPGLPILPLSELA